MDSIRRTPTTAEEQYRVCAVHFEDGNRRMSRLEKTQDTMLELIVNQSMGVKHGPEAMEEPDKILERKKKEHGRDRPTLSIPTTWNGPIELNVESRAGKVLLVIMIGLIGFYIVYKFMGG